MRGLAGLAAVAALAAPPVARADEPTKRDLLEAIELKLKTVHETAGPSIVCVVVSRSDTYPKPAKPPDHPGQLGGFDPAAFRKAHPDLDDIARRLDLSDPRAIPDHSSTGGVVIDRDGFVLVHYHAIDGATKLYVHVPGAKGSYADIHAADARSDLAVLKLLDPPPGLKPVKFGTARVYSGTDGKPTIYPGRLAVLLTDAYTTGFALPQPGVSLGSVANVRWPARITPRSQRAPGIAQSIYKYAPLVEVEGKAAAGASGAAVFDLDGGLLALTSSAAGVTGREGTAYALAFDTNVRRVVETLRRGEEVEYGFLGVVVGAENGPGITVDISPNSPASQAGLVSGDRITRINGYPVNDYEDLLYHAATAAAGTTTRLAVERGRREVPVELKLAKFHTDTPFIASVRPDPVFGLRVDYTSVLPLAVGAELPGGVAVRELVPDSPAAAKFKALGDGPRWVITRVNGTPVASPPEFYKAAKGRESVKLTVTNPADHPRREREIVLP